MLGGRESRRRHHEFYYCRHNRVRIDVRGRAARNVVAQPLPGHHLDAESKDAVKVGIGLIATMTALVLGLVTASAKSSYDAVDSAVKKTAVDVLAFDRVLARYGSETERDS